MNIRRVGAASLSALALTVTGVAIANPASAGPNNTTQKGLVNLSLTDTTVQLPIALAANVCGVAVNVLATATATSPVNCTATGVSTATRNKGGGGNNTRQNGLVNVAITDTTIQVPIAIAANICGVAVNILATQTFTSPVTCTALGGSSAR